MGSRRLQTALESLSQAIREVDAALEEMRSEHDPLAVHIFIARRNYRATAENDTKSGKRSEREARDSWKRACELGFRGDLSEWERLMGAVAKR